ncbi:helix-turn-helix domain-containing protein [Streptacidiphilus albus]|uniref:helix-turn-helix domain-containing protein n=1 Tax=Streptacidiphilus albus TaxID=105425 RepID=UPI00054C0BE0|nr:helix-turn-helix transcriptional regulator [Streptacidiphilus albus]
MSTTLVPIELPDWAWQNAGLRKALRARDIAATFRHVQQFGHSQARIAVACGMTQGRVNEIINGRREVSRLDVYERIADGLAMPDDARHLLGLAAQRERHVGGAAFDLAAFPEVVRVYAAQASAAAEIQRQARTAEQIDVLAVRGLGLLGLNDSLLRASLVRVDQPPTVRVLLLDPESRSAGVRAAEIGESADSLASGIRLTESKLRELVAVCDMQVYRYGGLPTWRIVRLDAALYLSAFDAGWEGHDSAVYKIMATPAGPLFRGFRRMFDSMIAASSRMV